MSAIYPSGIILPYAGLVNSDNPLPSGWLLCDGSAISRASYSDLYSVIKTTYTPTDDGTTFNLPDLRGRVVAGLETMSNNIAPAAPVPPPSPSRLSAAVSNGVNGSTLGATGGAQSHLLLATESGIAPHFHYTYASIANNTQGGGGSARLTGLGNGAGASVGATSIVSLDAAGAHNNVQPTIVLNYIIKI
jgi:microcystin-dependent protein